MKKGYSLVEISLVMIILGVIVMLTIPSLMLKINNYSYFTALKKAHNTLRKVEQFSKEKQGDMDVWSWQGTTADFDMNFKPFINILKDCGTEPNSGCFASTYTNLTGEGIAFSDATLDIAKVVTMDAMSIAYVGVSEEEHIKGIFYVDVNALKGPNVYGRDFFIFPVFIRSGIKPDGIFDPEDGITAIDSNIIDAECVSTGRYCATKALREGEMNY